MKNIAIVGGGREGLSLLPMLKKSNDARIILIADSNSNALIFKLGELGYRISGDLNIRVTSNLNDIREHQEIDLIIDASEDEDCRRLLYAFNLEHVEIISPLSARLIWGHRSSDEPDATVARSDKEGLLSSLREIVEAVNLTDDKRELLSMVLRVALSSSGADRGSIMLIEKNDQSMRIEVFQGLDEKIAKEFRGKVGKGIAGKVAESGEPLLLSGKVDDSQLDELRSPEPVKAALSVPLLADEKSIGVLNVSTVRGPDDFQEKDLKFLTELAAVGARIILRSQEMEEMRDNSDRFDAWRKISSVMNASMHMEKKLLKVSRIIHSYSGAECEIYTLEKECQDLYLKASSGKGFAPSTYYKLSVGEGVEGMAARLKSGIVMRGESASGEILLLRAYPLVSEEEELQGVLKVVFCNQATGDGKVDILTDELIAMIAEEIKNSLKEERITLKAAKISAINEAGINLISTSDLKDVSRLAASSAAMILEAEAAVIRLLNQRSSLYTIMAAHGVDDRESRLTLFNLDKKLAHDAIEKQETLMIPNFKKSVYKEKGNIPASGLSHPLKIEDEIIGTISLYDKISKESFNPLPFNQEDKEMVERFVSYVEKAIANIISTEESKRFVSIDELTSLPNAESIERRLSDELERARRYKRSVSFAFIEVANFNKYMRVYGHDGGEKLIRELGHCIRDGVRAFDVVGRFWGSRFGVILPESEEKGEDIIERLLAQVNDDELDPENLFAPQKVKIVCGFSRYSGDEMDGDDMIKGAAEELEQTRKAVLAEAS